MSFLAQRWRLFAVFQYVHKVLNSLWCDGSWKRGSQGQGNGNGRGWEWKGRSYRSVERLKNYFGGELFSDRVSQVLLKGLSGWNYSVATLLWWANWNVVNSLHNSTTSVAFFALHKYEKQTSFHRHLALAAQPDLPQQYHKHVVHWQTCATRCWVELLSGRHTWSSIGPWCFLIKCTTYRFNVPPRWRQLPLFSQLGVVSNWPVHLFTSQSDANWLSVYFAAALMHMHFNGESRRAKWPLSDPNLGL